jgi:hydrogenase maturation protease
MKNLECKMNKFLVGVGNYNMFDDSIGIRIVEHISENNLDEGFTVLDLSGNVIDVLAYFGSSADEMLIMDTAYMGEGPGSYKFFKPEEVISQKRLANMSSHEGDVAKIISLGKQTGLPMPKITIMGIEPLDIRDDFGLSDLIQSKFDDYVNAALDFMKK